MGVDTNILFGVLKACVHVKCPNWSFMFFIYVDQVRAWQSLHMKINLL